jgi:hypothetical protein
MLSAMVRIISAFAFALFFAQSTLCLAGFLEHTCEGCPGEVSCGHEADCEDDPCIEAAVRLAESAVVSQASAVAASLMAPLWVSTEGPAGYLWSFGGERQASSNPQFRPVAPLRI